MSNRKQAKVLAFLTSLRRIVVAATLTLGLTIGTVFVASPASATAVGHDVWGSFTISVSAGPVGTELLIPAGHMTGVIRGKGISWSRAGGQWAVHPFAQNIAPTICNWHLSVVFYEGPRGNDDKKVYDQPNNPDCSNGGKFWIDNVDNHPAAREGGSVCIRLYRDFGNERLASVCHNITKK